MWTYSWFIVSWQHWQPLWQEFSWGFSPQRPEMFYLIRDIRLISSPIVKYAIHLQQVQRRYMSNIWEGFTTPICDITLLKRPAYLFSSTTTSIANTIICMPCIQHCAQGIAKSGAPSGVSLSQINFFPSPLKAKSADPGHHTTGEELRYTNV